MIWRDTGDTPLIGFSGIGFDARAGFLILVWVVHVMMPTFIIMCVSIIFLLGLNIMGLSPREGWIKLRRKIAGNRIYLVNIRRIMS